MFLIFFYFISLLDAFDFADPNSVQEAFRTIHETSTELVRFRESLWQSVGMQNSKVCDLIHIVEFLITCNETFTRFFSNKKTHRNLRLWKMINESLERHFNWISLILFLTLYFITELTTNHLFV